MIKGAIADSFSYLSVAENRSVKASLRRRKFTGCSKIRKTAPEIVFLTKVAAFSNGRAGWRGKLQQLPADTNGRRRGIMRAMLMRIQADAVASGE